MTTSYFPNNVITIEVTNRCSAACIMCPREKQERDYEVMTPAVWKKIVDDAASLNIQMLDLCGFGDVFLDKDLFDKIRYAKSVNPNFKIYISTTGIAMTPSKYRDIMEYVDILKFSIYGFSKAAYEAVMKNVSYDKAMSNIQGLLTENERAADKIYTIGNYILLDENASEMQPWIDFWEPRLSEVYVWKPHNYLDGRNYRDITGKPQRSCGRPLEGPLNVAANGDAHVCCFDYNKKLVVGRLRTQSIMEVMNSPAMRDIQDRHRRNDFKDSPCETCDQTVLDESVLVYKSNPQRRVGMTNQSMYEYEAARS
jgi:radical SAM protein with 4Fe4S-binding SPASM domain